MGPTVVFLSVLLVISLTGLVTQLVIDHRARNKKKL